MFATKLCRQSNTAQLQPCSLCSLELICAVRGRGRAAQVCSSHCNYLLHRHCQLYHRCQHHVMIIMIIMIITLIIINMITLIITTTQANILAPALSP